MMDVVACGIKGGEGMGQPARHGNGSLDKVSSGILRRVRLLSALPEEAREQLIAKARQGDHPRGAIIAHEGDPIDALLVVARGRIKTFHVNADGTEQVLDVLYRGQSIWHGLFLPDHSYHYSVGCLTDTLLLSIRRQDVEDALLSRPEGALSLVRILSGELDRAEEKLMLLGIRDPRQRLAKYLLHQEALHSGDEIALKLEDIARSINLRPETVSRHLSALEREGLVVRLGRGRMRLVSRQMLRDATAP